MRDNSADIALLSTERKSASSCLLKGMVKELLLFFKGEEEEEFNQQRPTAESSDLCIFN